MAKNELSARRLDLAARGIDLLNSLTEIANSKNSITGIALEIGQWLGREKLNRHQLEHCLKEAQGIVRPNSNGKLFFDRVRTTIHQRTVRPFLIQPSGALGRLLLDDPLLTWLVSTTSSLFQFHADKFITDSLVDLIIYSRHETNISDFDLAWHPDRILLEPVLNKIVSSVWFNVVNSGNSNLDIPPEFLDVCSRGHHLDSKKLARTLHLLQQNHSKIMIQSQYIITNLAVWLLIHYHGRLRLVVGGTITYDHALGEETCEVEFRIDQACDKDGQCDRSDLPDHFRPPPDFLVFHDVGGIYERLFSGEYDTNDSRDAEPRIRHGFYEIATKYPRSGTRGRDSLEIQIYGTAQRILDWVLRMEIGPSLNIEQLAFPVTVPNHESRHTVGDLLARVPSLLNRSEGSVMQHCIVFADLDSDSDDAKDGGSDLDLKAEVAAWSGIPQSVLAYFPILRDLLSAAARLCLCSYCQKDSQRKKISPLLKYGCYQHSAFSDVMALLGHGIADGFGATDVSANNKASLDAYGVTRLLQRVRDSMEVSWEEWLTVAASVFLGCPTEGINKASNLISGDANTVERARTTVAVQFGSLAVVAPWLDITKQLKLEGCFSFQTVSGRLGIPASFHGSIQTTQSDFAVIKTQHTEQVVLGSHIGPHSSGTEVSILNDDNEVFSDVFLSATGGEVYTLLMRISSQSSSRLVDPSRAIVKISQQPPQMRCSHPKKQSNTSEWEGNLVISSFSFDELLLYWGSSIQNRGRQDENTTSFHTRDGDDILESEEGADGLEYIQPPSGETIDRFRRGARHNVLPQQAYVSSILDSYTKFNLALALCPANTTVLNDVHRGSCLKCAVMQATQAEITNGVENATRDRWIINTARDLRSDEATLRIGNVPSIATGRRRIEVVSTTSGSAR